jgi:hypothetical protein
MTGICNLSIIPIRLQPSDKSEMVSQLLFGETYTILDELNSWVLIRTDFDHYEGWIDQKVVLPAGDLFLQAHQGEKKIMLEDISALATDLENSETLHLVRGSILPLYDEGKFRINERLFVLNGSVCIIPDSPASKGIIEHALKYLNSPYLWGGKSPFGLDCSGFVQMVHKANGCILPRDAHQQANLGESISFISEAQPGDLAFFENGSGNIIHVGIMLGSDRIIHASGSVRIDFIDHNGIFNRQSKRYTHTLRIIKRLNF